MLNNDIVVKMSNIIVVRDAIAAQFLAFFSGIKIGVRYLVNKKRLQNATIPQAHTINAISIDIVAAITVERNIEHNVIVSDIIKRGDILNKEYKINVPSLKSAILILSEILDNIYKIFVCVKMIY